MQNANSAGVGQIILLSVLAVGVALFAVLDDGRVHAGQEHERTHQAVMPAK